MAMPCTSLWAKARSLWSSQKGQGASSGMIRQAASTTRGPAVAGVGLEEDTQETVARGLKRRFQPSLDDNSGAVLDCWAYLYS